MPDSGTNNNYALEWDKEGERFYETGVSNGVLYTKNDGDDKNTYPNLGEAWNGLTNASDAPSGGEPQPIWADNMKYLSLPGNEEFGLNIEAYQAPKSFSRCDGSLMVAPGVYLGSQAREKFGFAYKTKVGNDAVGDELGYKIHLAWNCLAAPVEKSYPTQTDSVEAISMSWSCSTTPIKITKKYGGKTIKPLSHLVIDSRDFQTDEEKAKLTLLEDTLFGSSGADAKKPHLPSPEEVINMFATPDA